MIPLEFSPLLEATICDSFHAETKQPNYAVFLPYNTAVKAVKASNNEVECAIFIASNHFELAVLYACSEHVQFCVHHWLLW
jgi:hypothetical protein